MKVRIKNFKNKIYRYHIEKGVKYYLQHLLPKTVCDELTVLVKKNDKIDSYGLCNNVEECVNPRIFEIELANNLTFEHLMVVLAHECVHVKQYTLNELKYSFSGRKEVSIWKKEKYNEDSLIYENLPWEIEARELEQDLYQSYLSEQYLTGKLDFNKINELVTY